MIRRMRHPFSAHAKWTDQHGCTWTVRGLVTPGLPSYDRMEADDPATMEDIVLKRGEIEMAPEDLELTDAEVAEVEKLLWLHVSGD